MDAVVKDARTGGAAARGAPGKRLAARIQSRATTASSNARQRRPVRWLRRASTQLTGHLRAPVSGLNWHGRRVILLDGSTVRVRPHGHRPTRFAPAANQHGHSSWCLIRVVAGRLPAGLDVPGCWTPTRHDQAAAAFRSGVKLPGDEGRAGLETGALRGAGAGTSPHPHKPCSFSLSATPSGNFLLWGCFAMPAYSRSAS